MESTILHPPSSTGSPSETLQYVELRRQSSQRCVAAYSQESDGSSQEIIPSQFCAGAGEDDDIPKDTCDVSHRKNI